MFIKRVLINNFLSIESADITFPETGLILVDGWNEDRGCANGVGKTAIFTAISWCIFNNFPRDISVSEITRRGTKKCSVMVEIESKGKEYILKRERPGDLSITDENSCILSDKDITSILDVTYEQYLLVGYFAQSLGTRFLNLNDTERKNLMTKLIGADVFSASKEKVDKDLKDLINSINKNTNETSMTNTKINTYLESIQDVNFLNSNKVSKQNEINQLKQEVIVLTSLESPDISKYEEVLEKLNSELETVLSYKGTLKTLNYQLKEIESQKEPIDHYDGSCPHCDSKLDIIDGDFIIHDSEATNRKIKAFKTKKEQNKASIVEKIDELNLKIEKEPKLRETIKKLNLKIDELLLEFNNAKSQIREKNSEIRSINQELIAIDKQIEEQNSLLTKINEQKQKLISMDKLKDDLNSKMTILKSISDIFSPTGVPAYVLDSLVETFNEKVQNHVFSLWPNALYELQTFKESKSGNVTAKMSDHLVISGETVSMGSLSGGELNCLSTAIDLAMLEVFEQYSGAFISPLILDEPFNNMDAVTRELVVELLQTIATKRLVIVVDHSAECKSLFDRVIMVTKKNGVSSVAW
jgi:DNA repair exonuclease SbcCD ATPase subunit